MKNNCAGLDLSLTASGIVILSPNGSVLHCESIKTKKLRGLERLVFIRERVSFLLKKFEVKTVAIEGYSFGSKGRAIISMGELGGFIRASLYDISCSFYEVSPNSLKAYVCDNGTATKDEVVASVIKRFKFEPEDDNQADAFVLARMLFVLKESLPKYCEKGGASKIRELRKNNPDYY